jgi:hypothetical protein
MNFAVEVYNISVPLKNGITKENLMEFYNLFNNTKSNFKKWFDTNFAKINSKIQTNINDNYLNDFFAEDVSVSKFYNNIKNVLKLSLHSPNQQINQESPKYKSILAGGTNETITLNDIRCFYFGIICYLFSMIFIDEKRIHKPKSKIAQYGGNIITLEEDWTGRKKEKSRLIFCVGIGEKKLSLKISDASANEYTTEIKIYNELSTFYKKSKFGKYILKYYNNGEIDINNTKTEYSFMVINDDNTNNIINNNIINNKIARFLQENKAITKIQYLVLEVDDKCEQLRQNLGEQVYEITQDENIKAPKVNIKQCGIIKMVFNLLFQFYIDIGFNHWDLHLDNLFINIDNFDVKFYDFDNSTTNVNDNNFNTFNKLWKGCGIERDKNEDRKLIGLIYDITRFLTEFVQNFESISCNFPEAHINKIIENVSDEMAKITNYPNGFCDFCQVAQNLFSNKKEIFLEAINDFKKNTQTGGHLHDHKYKYHKYKSKYINMKYK